MNKIPEAMHSARDATARGRRLAILAMAAALLTAGAAILQISRRNSATSPAPSIVHPTPANAGRNEIARGGHDDNAPSRPGSPTPATPGKLLPDSSPGRIEAPGWIIQVQVHWRGNSDGVPGATVAFKPRGKRGAIYETTAEATTDRGGEATVSLPASCKTVNMSIEHPDAAPCAMDIALPPPGPILAVLERGAGIKGTVRYGDPPLPAAGAIVRAHGKNWEVVGQTVVNSDGRFVIRQIGLPEVRLSASLQNWLAPIVTEGAPSIPLQPGEDRGPVDLILGKGQDLVGKVRDSETGAPILQGLVTADLPGRRLETRITGDGEYRIAGLSHDSTLVSASSPGYATKASQARVTSKDNTPFTLDFALSPIGEIEISLTDEIGQPLPDGIVYVAQPIEKRSITVPNPLTDAQGRVTLKDIPVGTPLMARAYKSGYEFGAPVAFSFAPGSHRTRVTLVMHRAPGNAEGWIEGRVSDSEGRPIPGSAVCRRPDIGSATRAWDTPVDLEGRYRMFVTTEESFTLIAHANGRMPVIYRGISPGPRDRPTLVDFILEPGHQIDGMVLDSRQQAIGGAEIRSYFADDGNLQPSVIPGSESEAVTDEDGRFHLESLPGPAVGIAIRATGKELLFVRSTPVDATRGFVLLSSGAIRGRVLDRQTRGPIPRFRVILQSDPTRIAPRRLDFVASDGQFEIAGLSPYESHTVAVEAEGVAPCIRREVMAEEPEDAEENRYLLDSGAVLAGRILRASDRNPIPGATIVHGYFLSGCPVAWETLPSGHTGVAGLECLQETIADANGGFSVKESDGAGLLVVSAPGCGRVLVTPADRGGPSTAGPLEIQLSGEGIITAFLGVAEGVATPTLQLSRSDGATQRFELEEVDAGGLAHWEQLAAGVYELELGRQDAFNRVTRFVWKFPLALGERRWVELQQATGPLSLTGIARHASGRPLTNGRITLVPKGVEGAASRVAFSGLNGRWRFDGLHPGAYEASLINDPDNQDPGRAVHSTIQLDRDSNLDLQL